MDHREAERLKSSIEQMHVPWLRVYEIVLDTTREGYELTCTYRKHDSSLFGLKAGLGAIAHHQPSPAHPTSHPALVAT